MQPTDLNKHRGMLLLIGRLHVSLCASFLKSMAIRWFQLSCFGRDCSAHVVLTGTMPGKTNAQVPEVRIPAGCNRLITSNSKDPLHSKMCFSSASVPTCRPGRLSVWFNIPLLKGAMSEHLLRVLLSHFRVTGLAVRIGAGTFHCSGRGVLESYWYRRKDSSSFTNWITCVCIM